MHRATVIFEYVLCTFSVFNDTQSILSLFCRKFGIVKIHELVSVIFFLQKSRRCKFCDGHTIVLLHTMILNFMF